jgi:hypothetical protein
MIEYIVNIIDSRDTVRFFFKWGFQKSTMVKMKMVMGFLVRTLSYFRVFSVTMF